MWENRPLTPAEGTLRYLAPFTAVDGKLRGPTNLADHPGDWFEFRPRSHSERIIVSGLDLIVAGHGLLQRVDGFGGAEASFELALRLKDRFGQVHDLAGSTLYTIEEAGEWEAGTHEGTVMDPMAGNLLQGASRAGLRGADRGSNLSAQGSVWWTSPAINLMYGREVERVVWEVDDLRDNAGKELEEYEIRFRVRSWEQTNPNWGEWQEVSALALSGTVGFPEGWGALSRYSWRFPAPLPSGDEAQWRVRLNYSPASGVAYDETPRRTPVVYSLGLWVRLDSHRWRFDSLAELLSRADERTRLLPNAWAGNADVALLRLPLGVELRAAESIRARFVTHSGTSSIQTFQVRAVGGVAFEEA